MTWRRCDSDCKGGGGDGMRFCIVNASHFCRAGLAVAAILLPLVSSFSTMPTVSRPLRLPARAAAAGHGGLRGARGGLTDWAKNAGVICPAICLAQFRWPSCSRPRLTCVILCCVVRACRGGCLGVHLVQIETGPLEVATFDGGLRGMKARRAIKVRGLLSCIRCP